MEEFNNLKKKVIEMYPKLKEKYGANRALEKIFYIISMNIMIIIMKLLKIFGIIIIRMEIIKLMMLKKLNLQKFKYNYYSYFIKLYILIIKFKMLK